MRKQQRLLLEQDDPPSMRWDPDTGSGVHEHLLVERDSARVRLHEARDHRQQRRFAGAVRPEDGDDLARRDPQRASNPRSADDGLEIKRAHRAQHSWSVHRRRPAHSDPPAARPRVASTIAMATTTSTSDSATAASASDSRCR